MKPLFLFALLVAFVFSFAQQNERIEPGIIKGKVSTSDGQQAGFISVRIKNSTTGTVTDENGNFEIRKLKPSNYTLLFSLAEYSPKEISVEVKANETSILNVQLQVTYAELQKVIVESRTASKYVETTPSSSLRLNYSLNEIPQNIQITTRQLLEDQGLITMSEAIRTVSGIQKNYGGLNDITLNIRGGEGSYNVFRNGLGGYWWNQQEDIAMVEKIEFIKGPAGSIVNNFPPGGFVNMVTKQPVRELVTSVNAEYGSYNLFRLSTDLGGAFSKKSKLSYRFNAGLHTQDRAFQYSHAERYFLCGAIKYEPDKKNSVTAEYNYMRGKTSGNNDDLPSLNGKMFSLPRNFAVSDAHTDKLIAADNYLRLLATHKFNDHWDLNFLFGDLFGKWGQGYRLNADAEIPVSNDTLYRYASVDDWRNFSRVAQVYLNGTFHTGKKIEHKVLTALDYSYLGFYDDWGNTDGKNFGLYIPAPDYYVAQDSLRNFSTDNHDTIQVKNPSAYLEDHIKIKEKLILTLAGRFTHENFVYIAGDIPDYLHHTTYNKFTPRFGLSWLFSDAVSVYTIHDQFFLPIYARTFDHKPLKPVSGYNIEAGLKSYFFNKKLNINMSAYRIVSDNATASDPLHPGYVIQTGQIVHNGVEFDMTGNITPSFMINANYAFADARVSKGDSEMVGRKKIGTPDHGANLWLKYKLLTGKLKGLSFGLGYQYMGHRSALYLEDPGGNVYLPVYNLFDAAISYRNEKFNIGLNVYNITNTQYATMGVFKPSSNEWRYTPGEPINFRLSLRINLITHKR